MQTSAASIVRKLWHYCSILRDDGLSYPDYVEQLTYLLFLKMADEQGDGLIAPEFSWRSFAGRDAVSLHAHYSKVLTALGRCEGTLGVIFRNARNKVKDPAKLRLLIVDLIGQTAWTDLSTDVKGDAYEGLLEKNAQDTKSGAGQYFTPRSLIDAIVECVRPQPGEVICDPACGTGGFLLGAHEYIIEHNPKLTSRQRCHLSMKAIRGVELVEEVARLATMNLLLHNIGTTASEAEMPVICEDSLNRPSQFKADVVLTNPPFGVKGSVTFTQGKRKVRGDLTVVREDFMLETSNKQLNFVQHVMSMVKPAGRAAIVVPDNVLFESGAAAAIRRRLLDSWEFHTVLRLPTGLFYAHGVKANVIFFDAPAKPLPARRRQIWVYDLRHGPRFSVKTNPLRRGDLDDFVACYESRLNSNRADAPGSHARWRAFSIADILREKDCNLDISWSDAQPKLPRENGNRLDEIAALIADDLREALTKVLELTRGQPTVK
ncbi:MAG: N-6 DNA methylase [bacterium]|nr:N-6 DNA methylase [bacterium]